MASFPIANVFTSDAFSNASLTAAINKMSFIPGRARSFFYEEGIDTTNVVVEERGGELQLVQTSPRGAPGQTRGMDKREARILKTTHLNLVDRINSESIQDVRAFGSAANESLMNVVARRQQKLGNDIAGTVENLALGALKGLILDADGTTIFDLFTEFGVSQHDTIEFLLEDPETDVRSICQQARRLITQELKSYARGGVRVHAFCSDKFFDALISHPDVKTAYERYQIGSQIGAALRNSYDYGIFVFGDIAFENYRGSDDGSVTIAEGEAILFPENLEVNRLYFSPGDFLDSVNSIGLPLYSRLSIDSQFGRWADLCVQSNPLPIVLLPKTLLSATANLSSGVSV